MRLLEHLFAIIAPDECLSCGQEGSLLCWRCREDALPTAQSRCYKCNSLTEFGAVCAADRRKSPLRHVFARTEYTGTAKELVHKMKFSYSVAAADTIAAELMNTIPALPPGTIITYVPTASSRIRRRGFDHAGRIARRLSSAAGLPCIAALTRLGQHRQVGSGRRERLSSMEGVFRGRAGFMIEGAPVLLVDDVVTTGASLEAAAKALKAAGAKSVDAVVFAHAK